MNRESDFVAMLDLSQEALTSLDKAGVETVGQLIRRSKDDLLATRLFKKRTIKEIENALDDVCLFLRPAKSCGTCLHWYANEQECWAHLPMWMSLGIYLHKMPDWADAAECSCYWPASITPDPNRKPGP
jgi:hypothetical protein